LPVSASFKGILIATTRVNWHDPVMILKYVVPDECSPPGGAGLPVELPLRRPGRFTTRKHTGDKVEFGSLLT
jgi:hypothetical protein